MNQTCFQNTDSDQNGDAFVPCFSFKQPKTILFHTKYTLIFLLLIYCFPLTAQNPEKKEYKNFVGINADFLTGLGFTYGYWPGKIGIHISALPIATNEKTLLSAALTGYYSLNRTKYFNGYLFLGNHLVTNKTNTEYNIGFGPGMEVGSRVVFSLRGGIGMFDVTDTFCVLPTVGAGLFLKF
jgi:hypothetical protein